MCESVFAVYLGNIVIPFPSRTVGLLTRLLHLVLTASRMFPWVLPSDDSLNTWGLS
jgi:hypothetical protein